MKYPDDFSTPAFPAGKFVATSRFMATAVMIVFAIIISLCGIIYWARNSQSVTPFLVSVSRNGENWNVVKYENHISELPADYIVQEAVLNKFIHNWFNISDDKAVNRAIWETNCSHDSDECTGKAVTNVDTCAIYCACDNSVFTEFKDIVLPTYLNLESEYAAVWAVEKLRIRPLGPINTKEGKWQAFVSVQTNHGILEFALFATTSYNETLYPKTLGYYVSYFKAYRIN